MDNCEIFMMNKLVEKQNILIDKFIKDHGREMFSHILWLASSPSYVSLNQLYTPSGLISLQSLHSKAFDSGIDVIGFTEGAFDESSE